MTSPTPPAPRNFARAAALYLAHETDFPSRWRRDNTLQTWRNYDASTGHWPRLLGDLAPLAREVSDRLEAAVGADLPPFVFRAVGAPLRDTRVRSEATRVYAPPAALGVPPENVARDWLDPVLTADEMSRATSWEGARDLLTEKYVARFQRRRKDGVYRDMDRAAAAPLIGPEQRDALLKAAASSSTAVKVLTELSGLPECAYARAAAPVEVDARAWVAAHLVAAPGVDTGMRWAHETYKAVALKAAPGVKPLDTKKFRALVEEAGIDVEHTRDGKFARGVALVDDSGGRILPPDTQPLRLVTDGAAS